jgi:hypothetical protein
MSTATLLRRSLIAWVIFGLVTAAVLPHAQADPCGMVPPIYTGPGSPIARIGLQKTYVFHKNGVETFVIRPGFTGNVDNFGMLIPFPTPPELRKVPDNVFEQIANAIDPPEVVIDLRVFERQLSGQMPMAAANRLELFDKRADSVQVLKEEAVGMYEVAVLAAGSAESLKKWMDQKGYQYPAGMDKVTNEYIQLGWCFVAVKTKVGKKSNADPRPGQRNARPEMPTGSVFDGYVQGMGFRFKSEELVVPMRLSAFNEGDLRNVVYLLTDGPRKIRSIPEEFVVRQLSGQQLFDNVTKPLPLRIIGGTEKDIPEYRRRNLENERNPYPHNGMAKELFAADLLAESTGNLSLEHEETEKELLRIGEYFGLRGADIDNNNAVALKELRDKTTEQGLEMLKGMTLTVVDGDFPRQVIANENLSFADYSMPPTLNTTLHYDATRFGPGQKKQGILKVGMIDWGNVEQQIVTDHLRVRWVLGTILGLATLGIFAMVFWRRPTVLLIGIILFGWAASSARADDTQVREPNTPDEMIAMLKDSSTSSTAIKSITHHVQASQADRDQMVKRLVEVARTDSELPRRGWAIAALAEIGGQDVDEYLLDLHADENQEMLVRTWAAAARVATTRTANGLIEKANLIDQFPALGRPIGLRLVEQMTSAGESADAEKVLGVTLQLPQLQAALGPAIMAFGADKLADRMLHSQNSSVRMQAAGYLGSIANQGQAAEVAEVVTSTLKFDPAAVEVPWNGGALFIPGISWGKDDARNLVGSLIRWHLWCDLHGKADEQRQIHNNLQSLGLAAAAGYQPAGASTGQWLLAWGKAVGKAELTQLLKEQDALDKKDYSDVLKLLN